MPTRMSVPDRERFLAALHVGVLSVRTPRGPAPLAVPVWYRYEPGGEVVLLTDRDAVKTRLIRAAGAFALCVQREEPPYRYVSVRGPATVTEDGGDLAEHRRLARRYLPPEAADRYLAGESHDLSRTVTVRMRPQEWFTADFSQELG